MIYSKSEHLCNYAWLIMNDKEAEFELWCENMELKKDNPWSLHFFKAEVERTEKMEKMRKSFFCLDGFFLVFPDLSWVFNVTKEGILKIAGRVDSPAVEIYERANGELHLVA